MTHPSASSSVSSSTSSSSTKQTSFQQLAEIEQKLLDPKSKLIDHIFISPHFIVDEYEIISDNAGGFFPSDHLPVRVSLSLREQ